jgi:hypothetical protein
MFTALTTAAIYCTVLHIARRIRAYVPPGKTRTVLDATLRMMGGGGGVKEPY